MSDLYPILPQESYKLVDGAIREWAEAHHLQLATQYKDYDVRSVDVVGPTGKQCQIWIDPPKDGAVVVHACPYAPLVRTHDQWRVEIADIHATLERAYERAIEQVGKPWTPR